MNHIDHFPITMVLWGGICKFTIFTYLPYIICVSSKTITLIIPTGLMDMDARGFMSINSVMTFQRPIVTH